jgi:hypothetical protein
VLRGRYGISYLPRNTNVYNFPVKQANSLDAPNSFSAAGSMATGFPPPTPVQIPQDGVIVSPPAQQFDVKPKDLFHSYVESWNIAVQRVLPKDFSVEAARVPGSTSLSAVSSGRKHAVEAARVGDLQDALRILEDCFGEEVAERKTAERRSAGPPANWRRGQRPKATRGAGAGGNGRRCRGRGLRRAEHGCGPRCVPAAPRSSESPPHGRARGRETPTRRAGYT